MAQPNLTPAQNQFVVNFARLGMTQTQAAKAAGYAFPNQEANRLLKVPEIAAAVEKERAAVESAANVSRKEVIEKLMETFDAAKLQSEPIAMVAALREVAKICGYYEPEVKKIMISTTIATTVAQIEELSDEELVKLIIEGESTRVEDDDDPAIIDVTPALPAPAAEDTPDGVAA